MKSDTALAALMKLVALPLAVLLLLAGLYSGPLQAQVVGGAISGKVTDASGAAISGAKVSIQNTATGVETTTTTNTQGIYNVPNLLPGNSAPKTLLPGFKKSPRGVH